MNRIIETADEFLLYVGLSHFSGEVAVDFDKTPDIAFSQLYHSIIEFGKEFLIKYGKLAVYFRFKQVKKRQTFVIVVLSISSMNCRPSRTNCPLGSLSTNPTGISNGGRPIHVQNRVI